MLREQERVIDHQVRALEELDDKSEHMIRLSMAALAGGVGLASLLLRGMTPSAEVSLLPLGLAAFLNLVALTAFVDAYVGLKDHRSAQVGPDAGWVAQRAQDEDWSLEAHLLTVVTDHEIFSSHNLTAMERAATRRRFGVHLLLGSMLAYAITYIYMVSGVIGT